MLTLARTFVPVASTAIIAASVLTLLLRGAGRRWRVHRSQAKGVDTSDVPDALPFIALQGADARVEEAARHEAEILAEQLSRNTAFLGDDAQARVSASFVVVVGVGAAGSHAAQLLARTGVRRIRLIDGASVTRGSLQSHAFATFADVGESKVVVTQRALRRIVPASAIDGMPEGFHSNNADQCLAGSPDFVLLCMPSVQDQAVGLAACLRMGTRAVTVLPPGPSVLRSGSVARQRLSLLHDVCSSENGRELIARVRTLAHADRSTAAATSAAAISAAATPADATSVTANAPRPELFDGMNQLVLYAAGDDISEVVTPDPTDPADPSARASSIQRYHEIPVAALGERRGGKSHGLGEGVSEEKLLLRPAILAGLAHGAAAACLAALAGQPLPTVAGLVSRNSREDAFNSLQRRERVVFGSTAPLPIWPEDIEFLLIAVWGRRCALSGACAGGREAMVLTRWDRNLGPQIDNLVLLSKPAAEAHDQALTPVTEYDPVRVRAVQCALARARQVSRRWRVDG